MSNTPLTVFFDVGGTLVESPDFFESVAKRLRVYKADGIDRDLVLTTFMRIYEERETQASFLKVEDMLSQTLRSLAKSHQYPDISDQSHDLVFEVYLEKSVLYPEVANVLRILSKSRVRMVIASDADAELMDRELAKYNIESYFSDKCVSESVKAYKPAVGFISYLRKYTVGNENCCYFVGDNHVDIESARRLGVSSILIDRRGIGPRFHADFTIQSLNDLLPILGLQSH